MGLGAVVAGAGRPLLHAYCYPSFGRLSVRSRRRGRLDRAALLHGGVNASHHLVRQYADLFEVEKEMALEGHHYQRTALPMARQFHSHRDEIEAILRKVYGNDTSLWMRRWRWFFPPPQLFVRRRSPKASAMLSDEGGVTAVVTLGQSGPNILLAIW